MIGKSFVLLAALLSAAVAQESVDIFARNKNSRKEFSGGEAACAENTGGTGFAMNTRGCSWYWVCNNEVPVGENRCPVDYHFNPSDQVCDYKDNVNCTIDQERRYDCPLDRVVELIPHPLSCKFIFN